MGVELSLITVYSEGSAYVKISHVVRTVISRLVDCSVCMMIITSSHDKTGFYLRGVQIYLRQSKSGTR